MVRQVSEVLGRARIVTTPYLQDGPMCCFAGVFEPRMGLSTPFGRADLAQPCGVRYVGDAGFGHVVIRRSQSYRPAAHP
jgi:hypothetical protein